MGQTGINQADGLRAKPSSQRSSSVVGPVSLSRSCIVVTSRCRVRMSSFCFPIRKVWLSSSIKWRTRLYLPFGIVNVNHNHVLSNGEAFGTDPDSCDGCPYIYMIVAFVDWRRGVFKHGFGNKGCSTPSERVNQTVRNI